MAPKAHCTKIANFKTFKMKTTHFGLESLRWMDRFIWSFVPKNMKNVKFLDIFKKEIRTLRVDKCPCRMCREYVCIRYLKQAP